MSGLANVLTNVLTKEDMLGRFSFLETGGYQLPEHLRHKH